MELVTLMRASVLLLGALLARCGKISLPMPGGDAIGLRSIDYHLNGLRAMGAQIDLVGGLIEAQAPTGLRGADITLPQSSVGATETFCSRRFLLRARQSFVMPRVSPRSPIWWLAFAPWARKFPASELRL